MLPLADRRIDLFLFEGEACECRRDAGVSHRRAGWKSSTQRSAKRCPTPAAWTLAFALAGASSFQDPGDFAKRMPLQSRSRFVV